MVRWGLARIELFLASSTEVRHSHRATISFEDDTGVRAQLLEGDLLCVVRKCCARDEFETMLEGRMGASDMGGGARGEASLASVAAGEGGCVLAWIEIASCLPADFASFTAFGSFSVCHVSSTVIL